MNYKKLSELAHVSVSTVSKAFSGSNDISEETREHVFAIAKEHGCFEKYFKSKYKRKVIAVICPEFYSKYYAAFCEFLQIKLLDYDGVAIMSSTNFDQGIEEQLIEFYSVYAKVDGMIIISPHNADILNHKIPTVLIGQKHREFDSVTFDLNGITEAVKELKLRGHKNIGYIGETLTESKKISIQNELKRQGLDIDEAFFYKSALRFQDAGKDGVRHFCTLGKFTSAIICAYDQIAFGAITELNALGYSVPDDISVIGMDNIDDCEKAPVKLSSISSLSKEIATKALDMLFERIDGKASTGRNITIPTRLYLRESVGKAK